MASKQTGSSHQPDGSERGGSGNFANDPEKASDAERKGGRLCLGRQADLLSNDVPWQPTL
jgi:general stress protein YciG